MQDFGFPHLDWNLLRSFVVIARSRSITDAAQQLHLTQPAVSVGLKRLEDQVGQRLIDRSSTSFALTEAGRVLLATAVQMTSLAARLPSRFEATTDVLRGEAVIVLASHIACDEFDAGLARFRTRHPEVRLTLQVEASREAIAMVASQRAQMAVCLIGERNPQLEHNLLYQEHFGFYCGPGHRLYGRSDLTLEDLAGEPSVGYPTERINNAMSELASLRLRAGMRPELGGLSHNIEEVRRMILAGFGIGPLPIHVAEAQGAMSGLWRLPPYDNTPRAEVYFTTRSAQIRSRIESELHRAMAEQAARRPPERRVYGDR